MQKVGDSCAKAICITCIYAGVGYCNFTHNSLQLCKPQLQHLGYTLAWRQFYDCLDDFFSQHVSFPTRKDSILDLVITDEPDMVSDLRDLGPLGTSDHHAMLWKLYRSHTYRLSDLSRSDPFTTTRRRT